MVLFELLRLKLVNIIHRPDFAKMKSALQVPPPPPTLRRLIRVAGADDQPQRGRRHQQGTGARHQQRGRSGPGKRDAF